LHLPKEEKEMKKFVGVVMALLMVGSLVFAANPPDQSVEISTTIEETLALEITNKASFGEGSAVTESPLGGSFYVNTQSNVWKGFTLKYSLEPLEGANSSDTIPVKVSAVVDTTPLDDVAVGDSTVSNQVLLTVDSGVTTETTTHSAQITVSASEANWATLHPADTYSATMTFTVTAN
jgi:hypothetical protein